MLCEICNKNEATIHVTRIVNGVKKEANLCSECAEKSEHFNLSSDIDMITPFAFPNILSGLMEYVSKNSSNDKVKEMKCKNCGSSYRELRQTGFLGCSQCYKYFNQAVLSIVKGVQGNVEHIGKIPKKSGRDLVQKNKILKLKQELQKAVTLEEYEKAAEIRDEIKGIEKNNK